MNMYNVEYIHSFIYFYNVFMICNIFTNNIYLFVALILYIIQHREERKFLTLNYNQFRFC